MYEVVRLQEHRSAGPHSRNLRRVGEQTGDPRTVSFISCDAVQCEKRQREDERDKPLDVRLLAKQAQTYRDVAEENDLLLVSSEGGEAETFGQIQTHLLQRPTKNDR